MDRDACILLGGQDRHLHLRMKEKQPEQFNPCVACPPNDSHSCLHLISSSMDLPRALPVHKKREAP